MIGAFLSHYLREMVTASEMHTLETAVHYQMIHSIAIAVFALMHRKFDSRALEVAILLFVAGIILFSGSLYLLGTISIWGKPEFRWIGAITPLGGVSFIAAWILLLVKGINNSEDNNGAPKEHHKHKRRRRHRSAEAEAGGAPAESRG
jgi:uncharacterized membrane protein YgdD (TMEM256/DUF423 family)